MQHYRNSIFLFLIFFLIYFLGSFTKIPFGDCMGFVLDTEKELYIKSVSPTTHFLYINTAVFIKKITTLDAINVNRLLVITSAAFVVFIIYKIVYLITRLNWIAIVTSFVFGFSFTFWKNAEIVEVYSYNMVWVALFLYYLIKTFVVDDHKNYNILWSGLFLSISMWTHIENIFFIPSFLLFLFYFKKNKTSVFISFLFLLSSFLLMIWINSLQNLPIKTIFTSEQGNWVENSFKKTALEYSTDLIKSVLYLIYNFNVFVIFGVFGAFKLYQWNTRLFYVISLAATLFYGFATFYAVSDNYVFFLPFNLIFALGIGIGLKHWKYQKSLKKLSPLCLLIPFVYLISYHFVSIIPQIRDFEQSKTYKGGLSYYVLPWMTENTGILEFTIEKRVAPEPINWMTHSANEYIDLLKRKGYTLEEIKKL